MVRRAATLLLLLTAPPALGNDGLAGQWSGRIETPGTPLEIRVDLVLESGEWTGSIDIPAQSIMGMAIDVIGVDDATIRFSIPGIPGEPTFTGTHEPGQLSGQLEQGGHAFPFTLTRRRTPAPARPQEPRPPFPYESREVTFESGNITIAGTLTTPSGEGPFPAAVLITGSGAQDRDETVFGHKPFWVLADHLCRHGIAVLRSDDRGVGGSSGSVPDVTSVELAGDVVAGVEYLARQRKIDPRRVGVIGHSEGGIVGPLAALETKDIAFVVMLAGPGVKGSEVVIEQTERIGEAQNADEGELTSHLEHLRAFMALVESEEDETRLHERARDLVREHLASKSAAERERLGDDAEQNLLEQTEAQLRPWFRFFFTYDPVPALEQLDVPVLALFAGNDLQVPLDQNAPPVRAALTRSGNPDASVTVLPGLNHLFQASPTGNPADYYRIEETINDAALDAIRNWILERFGTRP